jgi:hypothetical protein
MLDINSATARLARQMQSSERAVIDALIETTALAHTAAMALRDVSGAPPVAAQAALLRLSKTIESLVVARGDAARVHGQLREIGREMGATEEPTCPDEAFTSAELDSDSLAA